MRDLRSFILKLDSACKMYNGRSEFDNEGNVFLFGYGILINTGHCINQIEQYIKCFKSGDYKEPLGFDVQLQKCKKRLLNCSRLAKDLEVLGEKSLDIYGYKYRDEPIATARELRQLIEENVKKLKDLLNELFKKVVLDADDKFFENCYLVYKKKVDRALMKSEFDMWKMNKGELTIDLLREQQALVTAGALKRGVLRFEHAPAKREMNQVHLDILKDLLPCNYKLPADFDKTCAQFRRFFSWDNYIINLNCSLYGKYLFINRHRISEADVMCFAEMDVRVELINDEIRQLLAKQVSCDSESGDEADKYWQRLIDAGFVDHKHQLKSETLRKQAMYIAELFAEKLGLKNKWKHFEQLWHISNLAQEKWDLQQNGTMPLRYKEIDAIFAD